jgi:hypothetical protein
MACFVVHRLQEKFLSFINLFVSSEAKSAGIADPAFWQLGHKFIIITSIL